ncbi:MULTISPECIES: hypothetical protein [unclassified Streptomyces]
MKRTKQQKQMRTVRRLARTALFGAVRGAGTAAGSAVVAAAVWWLGIR